MIKNVLSELGGVGVYGIISLCLFFAVFAGVVVWGLCQKKSFLKTMSGLPLNDGTIKSKVGGDSNE